MPAPSRGSARTLLVYRLMNALVEHRSVFGAAPRRWWRHALALLLIAGAGLLPESSCGSGARRGFDAQLDLMTDAADGARLVLDDHERDAAAAGPGRAEVERRDLARWRALTGQVLEALHTIEVCSQEGRTRESVYLSETVGRIDDVLSAHAENILAVPASGAAAEEARFRTELEAQLDEIDGHLDALWARSSERPQSWRCARIR